MPHELQANRPPTYNNTIIMTSGPRHHSRVLPIRKKRLDAHNIVMRQKSRNYDPYTAPTSFPHSDVQSLPGPSLGRIFDLGAGEDTP